MKIIFYFFLFLLLPATGFAQIEYQTLAPLPGISASETIDEGFLSKYLNIIYILGISLCTALAVLMIVVGGVQWASSDAWSGKQEGKERIWAAVLGLFIALGSYVILNTINPALLNTELNFGEGTTSEELQSEESPTGTIPSLPTSPQPTGTGPSTQTPGLQTPGLQERGEGAADAILRSAQYAADPSHPLKTCSASGTNGGRLACAYAVNEIVESALGRPITNSLSTIDMYNALRTSSSFSAIPGGLSQSRPGDIVISPTQAGKTGHVGIVETSGGGTIISNSSRSAAVKRNYTSNSWTNYYGGKGLPVYVYRPN